MPYSSTITFTLDTICPWTYLAYLRLTRALTTFQTANPTSSATFTLVLAPYQLYPSASPTGTPKHAWYTSERYADDPRRTDAYIEAMRQLGAAEGKEFKLGDGEIANTLNAHRILYVVQERFGSAVACRVLEGLYAAYFEQGKHPSAQSTLLEACLAAGVEDGVARAVVQDESEGLGDVRAAIREQEGNAVDSVPYVVFEGRRRDFTLVGAKEVAEYTKILRQVEKECV